MGGTVVVGRLLIDMAADVAKLKVDMTNASEVVVAAGAKIDAAATAAKTALIGLAAALGPVVFAHMIGETIEATAALEKMSQKTGMSVEALSALRGIAKLVGVDFEAVGNGAAKLDKAMLEAATSGGKTASAFKMLGVSVKDEVTGALRSTDDVMLEVAKSLSAMEDGATKTALAQILLGKAGMNLIPVLNELGKQGEYQAKVTAQQALVAEDFEKNLIRLGANGREMRQIFANEVTPTLDALAKTILSVVSETGGLLSKVRELAADGSLNSWAQQGGFQLAKLADAIADEINVFTLLAKQVLLVAIAFDVAATASNPVNWFASGDSLRVKIQQLLESLGDVKKEMDKPLSTKWQDTFAKAVIEVGQMTPEVKKAAGSVEDFGKAAKEAFKAFDLSAITSELTKLGSEGAKLDAQIVSLQKYGQASQETALAAAQFAIENGKLGETLKVLDVLFPALAAAMRLDILATAADNDAKKIQVAVLTAAAAAYKAYIDQLAAGLTALQEQLDAEIKRNDQFGLTKVAIAELTIVEQERRIEFMRTAEASDLELAAEERRLSLLQRLKDEVARGDELQSWSHALSDASQGVTGFLRDFITNSGSAFKNAWQRFKDYAIDAITEIAGKQIVVSIAMALGLGGASGAQAAGGLLNQGGGLLSLLNSGNSLSGGSNFLSSFFKGGTGAEQLGGPGGADLGGPAAIGGASAGGLSLSTLGIVGLVAMAAPYIIGAFKREGGPKAWEYATGLFGLGDFLGTSGKGPNMTRQYGTSGADVSEFGDFSPYHKLVGTDAVVSEDFTTAAKGLKTGYDAILQLLGGKGTAEFAIYSSTDPKGTAGNQADVRAMVNGKAAYTANVEDVLSRDPADLQKELTLQAQRALLGAVQASDLPEDIAALIRSVDASTASADTIQSLFAFAGALHAVNEVLSRDVMADALKAIADASDTTWVALQKQGAALVEMGNTFDGTAASASALAQSTTEFYRATVLMVAQLEQAKTAIKEMFADSIKHYNFAGMDNSQKYNWLQQDAATLTEQLKGTSDPVIAQALAKKIDADMNEAFGLLSPEEQKAMGAEFAKNAQTVSDIATQKIADAQTAAIANMNQIVGQIRDVMTEAAAAMTKAANTQQSAANTFERAVNTPIEAYIVPGQTVTGEANG